ncbi:HPr family phosphocarrier protein [Lederbergia sp. NSJ-179]|uniref:HPr family phosphocarrier protein n=1 Tax=Lederbergia sp. NSJ-179 TaxID=2931402 RepID=UPI001FD3924A|nr:HPr family phosphocarrier protein [Lederbergia sp. NSJ-179]MCJ7840220.1 HPr family phosphocarrier protein [Lederbergia sp. NSJ-179]
MVVKEIEVKLPAGLQSRYAAEFVQEASSFTADVYLEKGGRKVNAKSIMGLMSLAIGPNELVTLSADGADEEEAVAGLAGFIENNK